MLIAQWVVMDNFEEKLVRAVREKRDREGLSIRALSGIVGISFSTLARIERGEGSPDNNSKIRLLEWLGADADKHQLGFDQVAFVHFRAGKGASSGTVQTLLRAAVCLRQHYAEGDASEPGNASADGEIIPMSKEELEQTAEAFRKDLGLKKNDPLDPFHLSVDSVVVERLRTSSCIDAKTKRILAGPACGEWSAMSVPLNADQDSWVVFLNDCHTIERQRVTLLEEYWHILSGHKLTKIAKIAGAFGRTYDSAEEHDAYFLASATLLPRDAVKRMVSEGKGAAHIAATYGTSPELVEYRIKRLGLWREHVGKKVSLSTP
ncbi:XRE family transcriptional regulator [Sphingomonas canadensis]|uniref:XRE family transcriptional regulator n=1 Tax=Sphingomonas canadensis TaxID=1219257 RepID=A0ABW3H714_9SPHN|nr:XRE family transcriptional regulator [Sphingomonas canadensis]MCW3835035.1 XRE family transcriptional regulator [Sphingomonas canadensis]